MHYLKILAFTLFVFSTSNAVAQKSNEEKILGCWVFKKVEFIEENDFTQELRQQVQNTVVCFIANGKFTTTMANSADPLTGTYSLSADGKTMIQKRDNAFEGIDEDAEIEFPDDKNIIFKLSFGVIYFERK